MTEEKFGEQELNRPIDTEKLNDLFDDVIPLEQIGKMGTVKVYNQAYVNKLQSQLTEKDKQIEELKRKDCLSVDCDKAEKHGKLCLGYGGDDDEPCEQCKNCIKCETGYYQLGETDKDEQLNKLQEENELLKNSDSLCKLIGEQKLKITDLEEQIEKEKERAKKLEDIAKGFKADCDRLLKIGEEASKQIDEKDEQIADLKDYVLKVSNFLHNNNNVRPDKLAYKERDMLLIKELKLFEKWELSK